MFVCGLAGSLNRDSCLSDRDSFLLLTRFFFGCLFMCLLFYICAEFCFCFCLLLFTVLIFIFIYAFTAWFISSLFTSYVLYLFHYLFSY